MTADKDKDASPESKNNWITPTVIVAVIGLIGTVVSLYVSYLTSTRPLELAATETAAARVFQLTVAALTPPTPIPSATASLSPTHTLAPTDVPPPASPTRTRTPTRTLAPAEQKFCINVSSIYVRSGPGTEYGAVGALTFEDCLYFDGRNPDSTWLRISSDQDAYLALAGMWARADLLRPLDRIALLPIILPPTATPTPEG